MKITNQLQLPQVNVGITFLGGCGTNTAQRIMQQVKPDEFPALHIMVANTDAQQLQSAFFPKDEGPWLSAWKETDRFEIVQLGRNTTNGWGAGGKPEVGRAAMLESLDAGDFKEHVQKLTVQLAVAGMGGGTGHGGLPELLKYSKAENPKLLSAAVVTMPFAFEAYRAILAKDGYQNLIRFAPIFRISNESVKTFKPQKWSDAWRSISDATMGRHLLVMGEIFGKVGDIINSDFSDICNVMCPGEGLLSIWQKKKDDNDPPDADKILSDILNPLFDGEQILKQASEVLLYVHGDLPPEFITDKLAPKINERRAVKEKQLHFSIRGAVEDGETWIALMGVAPHKEEPLEMGVSEPKDLAVGANGGNGAPKDEERKAEKLIQTINGGRLRNLPVSLGEAYDAALRSGDPEVQRGVADAIFKITKDKVTFPPVTIRPKSEATAASKPN